MVKIITHQKAVKNLGKTNKLPEKTKGAKRLRFLSACLGRIDRTKLRKN